MKKTFALLGILFAFGLVICWPLFGSAFIPTHDGEYHIIRFASFFPLLAQGYWFPRWAASMNSGYGVPLFSFHYPLPNYLGALSHALGVSYVASFRFVLAFGYMLALLGSFFWLRRLFSDVPAFVGTLLAALVPYWFVDMYIRGSVGEVLAVGIVMVILAALEYENGAFLSLGVASLILAHNISALLFVPFLFLYGWIRKRNIWPSFVLGIGLAMYFWLPALAERGYVTGLSPVWVADHFPSFLQLIIPSWGSGFSMPGTPAGEMSQQLGVIPIILFLVGLWYLIRKKGSREQRALVLVSFVVLLGVLFLLLPLSAQVWQHVPGLSLVQYPWRLLTCIIFITGIVGSYVVSQWNQMWVKVLFVIISFCIVFPYTKPVLYQPRTDQYYLSKHNFTDGTSSLGNTFAPRWSSWKEKRSTESAMLETGTVTTVYSSALHKQFSIDSQALQDMKVSVAYYPGWQAYLDRWIALTSNPSADGLVTFLVSPGEHQVDVVFEETLLRAFADACSLACLFWFLGWAILTGIYAYRDRHIPA